MVAPLDWDKYLSEFATRAAAEQLEIVEAA